MQLVEELAALVQNLLLGLLFGGLFWIPAYHVHRRRIARGGSIGLLGKCAYIAPAIFFLWLPLFPSRPALLTLLRIRPWHWLLILVIAVFAGLKYYKRALGLERVSLWKWIRRWPGIAGPEPDATNRKPGEIFQPAVALPVIAGLVSLGDLLVKLLGFFEHVEVASYLQFGLVAASLGAALHVMTASTQEASKLGGSKEVARYPKRVRVTTIAAGIVMLGLWMLAASTEPSATLVIASATRPSRNERQISLTLVNRGSSVRILQGFEVESRSWVWFHCSSADFAIPLAGQYNLKFHVAEPLTEIPASPPLQFEPNQPGIVVLALQPDATGACSDTWEADVRIGVVADDGRRSWTHYFRIGK